MEHASYQYFSQGRSFFQPKTQKTALQAHLQGYIPRPAYIWKAVNVRPVFEEPYDLLELEKLLAKPELDLETAHLLMKIFERLIRHTDKEIALFASESIGAMELRYDRRIQLLKKKQEEEFSADRQRLLVKTLMEFALLYFAHPVLKSFYLTEAYTALTAAWKQLPPRNSDLALLVQLELERGQPSRAERLLKKFLDSEPDHPFYLKEMMKVQFALRNFTQVLGIMLRLKAAGEIDPATADFWTGEVGHG